MVAHICEGWNDKPAGSYHCVVCELSAAFVDIAVKCQFHVEVRKAQGFEGTTVGVVDEKGSCLLCL